MTGSNRKLGLLFALTLAAAPVALAQDAQSTFKQAVEMLQRDRKAEALALFQQLSAMELTPDQAYELWQSTDPDTWLDLLAEGGQVELIAKSLSAKVSAARREHKADPEAIKALVAKLENDDPVARLRVVRELSANHGEYAVQYLISALGDSGNEERRITNMNTLVQLSVDAVQPLLAALHSDNAFLRRNVITVLGMIGDMRAGGALAAAAKADPDSNCQAEARNALARVQGTGDAAKLLCSLGERYHLRSSDVLPDYAYSDVVWRWAGQKLDGVATPRPLYADELAKGCFLDALAVDSSSADAHAGLARATASELAIAETIALGGGDAAALTAYAEQGSITLNLAGPAALDAALSSSVAQNDAGAAVVLVRTLGRNASQPTAGLTAALQSKDGAIRGEAAVACARMAAAGKGKCSPEVIAGLGEIAGREVVRVAMVIDADTGRANTLASALQAAGIMPTVSNSAALGLSMLRRVPGVDAIVVADQLPDLTAGQVIDDIRSDSAFAKTPVMLLSSTENAGEPYGDRIQGVIAQPGDVTALKGALDANVGSDRARADALSVQASEALAGLAGKEDIRGAVPGLTRTLTARPDAVVVPAARALGIAGGAEQIAPLAAVVADGNRSEAARTAGAYAIASIVARGAAPSAEVVKSLHDVAHSDAPLGVRQAAAAALGNMNMSTADRAQHLMPHAQATQG